ncbi:hypothetical protein QMG83_04760 [Salinibacterium sp. G-O1]|uniref:hypothetical protein n=1 Tax=Salinibacterium sp. G-O1 TaxID=3046208 RepID=UPI0024B95271|nr:hypothetical protein [Salinibacterium sp. G-O1]MDJ0334528.1 hypothetical protein [Salinibacterium sp. G-O1]
MRARTSIALVALAVLLLSGCLPQPSTVTPTPEASSTPVFASDEEALAAATAAYAAYLAMSDQIAADGGVNPQRLEPFVTEEWLKRETGVFSILVSRGMSQTGSTSFRDATLQQYSNVSVSIYVCADSSETRFHDSAGGDVTPANRQTLNSLEVTFEISEFPDLELRLEGNEPWSGESFC